MTLRFYQVHKTCDGGTSAGFEWYISKRRAGDAARGWIKDNPDESADVEAVDIDTTKAGILRALMRFASHPDNG